MFILMLQLREKLGDVMLIPIVLYPLLFIWSLNTLFALEILYSWSTYFASWAILLIFELGVMQ